jgi:hypothetical protein
VFEMMKARHITLPAMLAAVSLVLMLLSGTMDTGKLGTLVLLSLLPVILIHEGWMLPAAASYGAVFLLSLVLVPDKVLSLAYGLFFGPFAFLWYALKKVRRTVPRLLLAVIAFNAVWLVGLYLVQSLWSGMPFVWVYLAGQPIFIAYFFLYGFAVKYYQNIWAGKIHRWMGGRT